LRRVNDFSFFIFVDFYEVNLFQDETAVFPIPANHSIIFKKNGCKIGKTCWFLLSGTVL